MPHVKEAILQEAGDQVEVVTACIGMQLVTNTSAAVSEYMSEAIKEKPLLHDLPYMSPAQHVRSSSPFKLAPPVSALERRFCAENGVSAAQSCL